MSDKITLDLNYKLTPRQCEAFEKLTDDKTTQILYGGAKGGGKSFLFCVWVLSWCQILCEQFGLKVAKNPLALGFIGRKQAIDFRKTTLETWKKTINPSPLVAEIKDQKQEIILFGGKCKLFFGGLDSSETINKFNSAELAFCAIDQAEETEREEINVLKASLRLKHNGIQPVYKELYTANPADCWLKNDFIDNPVPGSAYIPALPSDNRHLPTTYINTLEQTFRFNQPLLQAYRDGNWHSLKGNNVLISPDMLNALQGITHYHPNSRRIVAIDPATSFDECVIYAIEDYKIIDELILCGVGDVIKLAGEASIFARRHDIFDVCVDSIGLGAGVADALNAMGFRVQYINSAETVINQLFVNRRAEMWWKLTEMVQNKEIGYPADEELRRQLCAVRFQVVRGKIQLELKQETKKRLGRSPDRADAFCYGITNLDNCPVWTRGREDKYTRKHEQSFNPMTV